MGILLGSRYPSFVPRLLCTRANQGKRLPGIYKYYLYSWARTGQNFVADTCNHRPLWRCVGATGWYCSLWSTRLSNVLSMQNLLLLVWPCYQQMSIKLGIAALSQYDTLRCNATENLMCSPRVSMAESLPATQGFHKKLYAQTGNGKSNSSHGACASGCKLAMLKLKVHWWILFLSLAASWIMW